MFKQKLHIILHAAILQILLENFIILILQQQLTLLSLQAKLFWFLKSTFVQNHSILKVRPTGFLSSLSQYRQSMAFVLVRTPNDHCSA